MINSRLPRASFSLSMIQCTSRNLNSTSIATICVFVTLVGCGQRGIPVHGTVTANDKPVDSGTITFSSAAQPVHRHGAVIENGRFSFGETSQLTSGEYEVMVEGLQKTGRTVKDPQRGELPEMATLKFVKLPLRITVSTENAQDIQVSLTTSN